jgi:hypothetical protein
MTSRSTLLMGIGAGGALLAGFILVLQLHDEVPNRRTQVAPPAPHVVASAPVLDAGRRTPGPAPAAAPAPAQDEKYVPTPIPTELPESPELDRILSRDGADPEYREAYTYQLGLMAYYDRCLHGRIKKGSIFYSIVWQNGEGQVAYAPKVAPTVPPEGDLSPEDLEAFYKCVQEYVDAHSQLVVPALARSGSLWGLVAVFPITESNLLHLIDDVKHGRPPVLPAPHP